MPHSKKKLKAVLITGFIAGALDLAGAIVAALLTTGKFPLKILETIAGGAFGPGARDGGWVMKGWGLFFHFVIALAFIFIYFLIYPKMKLLQKNVFFSALLYGLFAWGIMNVIILPLSAYHSPVIPPEMTAAVRGAFVLILCIGLPAAIGARNYYKK